MKNIYTYLTMAVIAIMSFSSCEDSDTYRARTLEGTWTGYIDTYYRDRWGWSGNNYRTTIYFERRGSYGGVGYEVDYNINNPYSGEYYSEFDWEVYNGEICITYADSYSYPVYIYDYDLYDDYFEGYMDDGTNRDIHFELYYDGNFNWGRYYDGYYASTRGVSAESDSTMIRGKGFYATGEFAKALKKKKEASN